MATEYGIRDNSGDEWGYDSRVQAENTAKLCGALLIAREVSEPRIVSIRA